jgi:hypothetical protein
LAGIEPAQMDGRVYTWGNNGQDWGYGPDERSNGGRLGNGRGFHEKIFVTKFFGFFWIWGRGWRNWKGRGADGGIYEKKYKKSYLGLDIAGGSCRIDIVVLAVLLTRAGAAVRDLRDFTAIVQEAGDIGDVRSGCIFDKETEFC